MLELTSLYERLLDVLLDYPLLFNQLYDFGLPGALVLKDAEISVGLIGEFCLFEASAILIAHIIITL